MIKFRVTLIKLFIQLIKAVNEDQIKRVNQVKNGNLEFPFNAQHPLKNTSGHCQKYNHHIRVRIHLRSFLKKRSNEVILQNERRFPKHKHNQSRSNLHKGDRRFLADHHIIRVETSHNETNGRDANADVSKQSAEDVSRRGDVVDFQVKPYERFALID